MQVKFIVCIIPNFALDFYKVVLMQNLGLFEFDLV